MKAPFSPVTMVTRSFIGDSQFTRWFVTVPSAREPDHGDEVLVLAATLERRPGRHRAERLRVTQAVRSMSCVARSLTTPTSAMRAGNGPCRRVTIW